MGYTFGRTELGWETNREKVVMPQKYSIKVDKGTYTPILQYKIPVRVLIHQKCSLRYHLGQKAAKMTLK
jgi:hypothetical protein